MLFTLLAIPDIYLYALMVEISSQYLLITNYVKTININKREIAIEEN